MTKTVNIYNVYDLDAWSRNPTNDFKFRNCWLGSTDIVKNSDKEKHIYSGYGITFHSASSWSCYDETARNVIILGVDNISSSHPDNCKNNLLVLGEVQFLKLMEALVHQKKSLVLILKNQTQNVAKVCIIMLIIVICLLME